ILSGTEPFVTASRRAVFGRLAKRERCGSRSLKACPFSGVLPTIYQKYKLHVKRSECQVPGLTCGVADRSRFPREGLCHEHHGLEVDAPPAAAGTAGRPYLCTDLIGSGVKVGATARATT